MPPTAGIAVPRDVTDEEIAHYEEHGWTRLDGFIPPETAAALLDRIKRRMGDDAAGAFRTHKEGAHRRPDFIVAAWRNWEQPGRDDDVVRAFSHSPEMARAAARLMGERRVRFWKDEVLCKLPESEGGGVSPWHQDAPYIPVDRDGMLVIWIALVDMPPERGTLRFLDGSHRLGHLGRTLADPAKDMKYHRPELFERLELSPPLHLKAGDATAHDLRTIHAAPANTTGAPRWAFSNHYFPADAQYTGAKSRITDDLGLAVNQPLDHPELPVVEFTVPPA
jgi:ectoine hydroxylase-related dioxygenase (phytanoyl-CoA dioxygenase family)